MPRYRGWMHLGRALGDSAQSLGDSMEAAEAEAAERRQAVSQQAEALIWAATELSHDWVSLEEDLNQLLSQGLEGQEVEECRSYATEERIKALAATTRFRAADLDAGSFQPITDKFLEIAELQVVVYDAILRFCDDRDPAGLDYAVTTVRYGQSLCEEILVQIPEIAHAERSSIGDGLTPFRCGCVAIAALAILIALFAWICG